MILATSARVNSGVAGRAVVSNHKSDKRMKVMNNESVCQSASVAFMWKKCQSATKLSIWRVQAFITRKL
jgi:hypothetical protein